MKYLNLLEIENLKKIYLYNKKYIFNLFNNILDFILIGREGR